MSLKVLLSAGAMIGALCSAISLIGIVGAADQTRPGAAAEMQSAAVEATPSFYRERLQKASPEIRHRLDDLAAQSRAKGWTFGVGYTEAMDRRVEDLAGTKIPTDFLQNAKRQNEFAEAARRLDIEAAARANIRIPLPKCSAGLNHFDWVDRGKVTPVDGPQGCGNCWSYSAVGSLEASYLARNGATFDGSEQQVVSCSGGGTCGGGWYAPVFQWFIAHGVGRDADLPDAGVNGVCPAAMASPYRAVNWGFVDTDHTIPSVAQIKQAICDHGPISVAVYATPAFIAYTHGVFNETDYSGLNHAVILTGWDETKASWHLKNSWGTGWGESGYMWIRYNSNRIGYAAAWVQAASNKYIISGLRELAEKYRVIKGINWIEPRPIGPVPPEPNPNIRAPILH